MTTVRFRVAGADSVIAAPLRRFVDDAGVTLPVPATHALDGETLVELEPSTTQWCWVLREVGPAGITRHVAVPDTGDVLNYEDLTDLDVTTFEPVVVEGAAAWDATLAAVQASADAAAASAVEAALNAPLIDAAAQAAVAAQATADAAAPNVLAGKKPVRQDDLGANVKDYGAKVDGKNVTTGAMTAGSATLTVSSGFAAGDVGKVVAVYGAGAAGKPLYTTIAAYVSSTTVTLAATAGTTVTGADTWWGTDDTLAVQAAIGSGLNVFIPKGICIVDAATRGLGATAYALDTVTTAQNITGAGRRVTTIKLMPNPSQTSLRLLDFYGATLSGLKLDGGFVPAFAQQDLANAVSIGQRGTIRDCHVLNAQGSTVYIGIGATVANNRIEKFGDHAIYDAHEPSPGATGDTDIYITNNQITEDATYHNTPGDLNRGAIKLRYNVHRAVITGNSVTASICVLVSAVNSMVEGMPSGVVVSNNVLVASYAGVHLSTDDITPPADAGFRMTDTSITGNQITLSGTGCGVAFDRASALVSGNVFTGDSTSVGISEIGTTADIALGFTITGNTFRGLSVGVYGAPSGSVINGNRFVDCATSGIYAKYGVKAVANYFGDNFLGINVPHGTSGDVLGDYSHNHFASNTTGIKFQSGARSYNCDFNTFAGNGTSANVGDATSFNTYRTRNNFVWSGAALPTVDASSSPIVWGGDTGNTSGSLPPAAGGARGRIIQVRGTSVEDGSWTCVRKADNTTYAWRRIALIAATGTATLTGGTVTVADTAITASSVIRVASKTLGGTPGALFVSAKNAGVGFTITSTSGSDTSSVQYDVVNY